MSDRYETSGEDLFIILDEMSNILGRSIKAWQLVKDFQPEEQAFSDEDMDEAHQWMKSTLESFINKRMVAAFRRGQGQEFFDNIDEVRE